MRKRLRRYSTARGRRYRLRRRRPRSTSMRLRKRTTGYRHVYSRRRYRRRTGSVRSASGFKRGVKDKLGIISWKGYGASNSISGLKGRWNFRIDHEADVFQSVVKTFTTLTGGGTELPVIQDQTAQSLKFDYVTTNKNMFIKTLPGRCFVNLLNPTNVPVMAELYFIRRHRRKGDYLGDILYDFNTALSMDNRTALYRAINGNDFAASTTANDTTNNSTQGAYIEHKYYDSANAVQTKRVYWSLATKATALSPLGDIDETRAHVMQLPGFPFSALEGVHRYFKISIKKVIIHANSKKTVSFRIPGSGSYHQLQQLTKTNYAFTKNLDRLLMVMHHGPLDFKNGAITYANPGADMVNQNPGVVAVGESRLVYSCYYKFPYVFTDHDTYVRGRKAVCLPITDSSDALGAGSLARSTILKQEERKMTVS